MNDERTPEERFLENETAGLSPELSPAERAAWEQVHAFRYRYFQRHRRMPRHGLVMKRLKAELADG